MTTYEMYKQLSQRYNPSYYAFPSTRYNKGKDIEQMNFNDAKILIDGRTYNPNSIELDSDYESTRIRVEAFLDPFSRTTATNATCSCRTPKNPTIENVIFNPPATIVFWSDHSKTVVKADLEYEAYDPEKGIAMAIAKKLMGDNKGHYYEMFKHWLEKWEKQNETEEVIVPANTGAGEALAKLASDICETLNKRKQSIDIL